MPWPEWMDKAEELAKRVDTCPDCWYNDGDRVKFPIFGGDGCRHKPSEVQGGPVVL